MMYKMSIIILNLVLVCTAQSKENAMGKSKLRDLYMPIPIQSNKSQMTNKIFISAHTF